MAVITLIIERTGGSLSMVSISYQTNPIGRQDDNLVMHVHSTI